MRKFLGLLAAALAPATASAAQPPSAPAAVDYSLDRNWLCLPGRADTCSTPLATTELSPRGYGAISRSLPASDPPVDCFYVYPTMSRDPGLNSDLDVDEERSAAQVQFARFAGVCRTFAPIYRQLTLGAVAAMATGADIGPAALLAYSDVANAWRNFLQARSGGRPFVLISHSQGSALLQQLIAREIETRPAVLARMKLAILPGYNLLVPQGRLVGGTFARVPLCSRSGETGCAISYTSFRERNAPPVGAMFGFADRPGMTVACVNPAAPGATGWVPLTSIWYARSGLPVPGGPIRWSSDGPPPTPFLLTRGLVSARCVNDGPRGYLSIRTDRIAGAKWTDHVGGEVAVLGMFLPGWGMHLSDIQEALGDLVRRVGELGGRR